MDELSPAEPVAQKLPSRRNLYIIIAVVMVVLVAGAAYYFYDKAQQAQDPQAAAQEEAKELVAVVGKLMLLPTDELPIVATVADPEKLKGQVFFQNAVKGDKVLIYNTAKKAILYNPTENKIVDVAPLSVGQNPQ